MTFWQKMFSFEGRLGRQDFWMCTLILWGVSLASVVMFFAVSWTSFAALAGQSNLDAEDPAAVFAAIAPLLPMLGFLGIFQLALIWPSLAVCAKRLHDRDQTALWLLLYAGSTVLSFVPFLGILFGLGVRIWWLVNLGILEGTRGTNRYGPSSNPAYGQDQVFA